MQTPLGKLCSTQRIEWGEWNDFIHETKCLIMYKLIFHQFTNMSMRKNFGSVPSRSFQEPKLKANRIYCAKRKIRNSLFWIVANGIYTFLAHFFGFQKIPEKQTFLHQWMVHRLNDISIPSTYHVLHRLENSLQRSLIPFCPLYRSFVCKCLALKNLDPHKEKTWWP